MHGYRPLHQGDARVPQSSPTIEGGEGGGATRFVSGSKKCLPQSCELLVHFREEWHRRGALRTSVTPTEKPFIQPRRIGRGGGFHTSPKFSVAWESMAIISGSGSDNTTTPGGGNAARSSSPEREGSPSNAAIDIWSSEGALKETRGALCPAEGPARSVGSSTGCGVL